MRIRQSIKREERLEFRPLHPVFDQCRRIDHGQGQLINVSWLSRSIRSALDTGKNCDVIGHAMVPARKLVRSMDVADVAKYRTYAAQLSAYDCNEPLIVVYKSRNKPENFDPNTCEILDGKARAVRAQALNISLPVIFVSRTRARFWGMAPWARRLGTGRPLPVLSKGKPGGSRQRKHKCRSGLTTLPEPPRIKIDGQLLQASKPIVSERTAAARKSRINGRVTHPTACSLVLSSDGGVRNYAQLMLASRVLQPCGLIDVFPEPAKSGPSTPRHQETCLLILFAKLLKALRDDQLKNVGKSYDDLRLLREWDGTANLRLLMRQLLRLSVDKTALECPSDNARVADELRDLASRARKALAKAGPAWTAPLSERLLLFSATHDPKSVKESEKADILRRYYIQLLEWTLRALFRAQHWRIGCNSIERLDTHGHFHKANRHDVTTVISPIPRISHEVVGSVRFQALTDLDIEPLLILAMHARFNPFLIWHDMRWAVPLGHWAMAIADLDAGRPTHVAVWMAELYEEHWRRNFEHRNHFAGPTTMILHWLHWVCGDVVDFSRRIHEICEEVIHSFPQRSGRQIECVVDDDGRKTLGSQFLKYQEDWALQATLFA